jgi:DNA-directed RNA polymerase specialized sigma24 family protein
MKNTYHIQIQRAFVVLKDLKKDNKKDAFRDEFMGLLPAIKLYIKNSIETASKKELLKQQGYSVGDFVNELYIYVYDHIEELENQDEFHIWLFEAIDKLIEDALIDEEFEDFFFKDIDDYSKQEWDAMEEEFSTDGDGDLVLLEELDDPRLNKNNYELRDVFKEDTEQELTEKLEKELSQERIDAHTKMVLKKLPMATQRVYDLYALSGFDSKDIARIKRNQINAIDTLLDETQNILKTSFKSRFLK